MFGWIYLGTAFEPYHLSPKLPTQTVLELLAPRFGFVKQSPPRYGGASMGSGMARPGNSLGGGGFGTIGASASAEPFFQIGHCLFALLAALLGGLLGSRFVGAEVDESERNTAGSQAARAGGASPRKRLIVRLVFVLSGLALVATIMLIAGAILPTGLCGGATFLLTWVLIGLVAPGALTGPSRRREVCLGAALFGAGFMVVAFGRFAHAPWPQFPIPTVELLDEIRTRLPAMASGLRADAGSITAANARIHEALKQPVPMRFNEETPFEDVVKSIREATRAADGKGIPIYVDPIGLSEADKTMSSTVRNIELEGVPLRAGLRVCLDQLDLACRVKDGLLLITSREANDAVDTVCLR